MVYKILFYIYIVRYTDTDFVIFNPMRQNYSHFTDDENNCLKHPITGLMRQGADLGHTPGHPDSQARAISAPKQLPPPSQLLLRETNFSFRYCIYNKTLQQALHSASNTYGILVLSDCLATVKGREKRN